MEEKYDKLRPLQYSIHIVFTRGLSKLDRLPIVFDHIEHIPSEIARTPVVHEISQLRDSDTPLDQTQALVWCHPFECLVSTKVAPNQVAVDPLFGHEVINYRFEIKDVPAKLFECPQRPWCYSARDVNVDAARQVGSDVAHCAQDSENLTEIIAPSVGVVVIEDRRY